MSSLACESDLSHRWGPGHQAADTLRVMEQTITEPTDTAAEQADDEELLEEELLIEVSAVAAL